MSCDGNEFLIAAATACISALCTANSNSHSAATSMKFLLVLALAVLVTARPFSDEWEQFKKVWKLKLLIIKQPKKVKDKLLSCRLMARATKVMMKKCDATPSGKLIRNTLRHTMQMQTNLDLLWE